MRHKWQHSHLLTALLVVCFLGAAAALARDYARQRAAIEDAAIREMTAICDIETAQIHNWRQERLGDGRVLMALPQIGAAERLAAGAWTDKDHAAVLRVMAAFQREFGYSDLSLVQKDGQTLARLDERTTDSRIRKSDRAALAREAKEPTLSDIGVDRDGKRLITLTVPVGEAGALILAIDPTTFLDPYLKSWRSASRTGETYLARREPDNVVYLTELRHRRAGPPWRRPTTGWSLAPEHLLPDAWVTRGSDYRGVPVILRARRVPDSRWFLLVKKDLAEIDEPLTRLAWQLAAVLGLIGIACAAGVGWIWKSHQLTMRQDSEERLRSFANDSPALLWVVSADGQNVFINQRLSRFLRADQEQSFADWQRFIHTDDRVRVTARLERSFGQREDFSDEARVLSADGEPRWMLAQAVPRISGTGEFAGYAGALLDITERKEAEERLRSLNAELGLHLREQTAKEAEIRRLSARLINAREEEHRRLSRELHDDLSQQIAALSIGMGNLKRGMPKDSTDLRAHCDKLQQRLVDVSESVRRMSHKLHPAILEHSGLAAALRAHCREFEEQSGVRIALRIEGDWGGVHQDLALTIFRIVQEGLRNIAKHAHVDRGEVTLTLIDEEAVLTIEDRGVGLPPNGAASAGLGLVSLRERTRLVNGSLEIESAPAQGTRLTVRVPFICSGLSEPLSVTDPER